MIDIEVNFKGTNKCLECRVSGIEEENFSHLFVCKAYENSLKQIRNLGTDWMFGDDIAQIQKFAETQLKILELRDKK